MEHATKFINARSESDIVAAVRAARAAGGYVRAVGSQGSKNGIYATGGVALCTDRYDQLVSMRGGLVTVQAGMTCGRLNALLRREHAAVPTVGEWGQATVAGAIATATHGGSAYYGIMPTSLHSVRLVTGTGDVVELARGSRDFEHVGVSLGALGIISTVTLECVPRFNLRLSTDVMPFDDYLRDPLAHERRSEFHSAVWVPSARRVITFAAERTTAPRGGMVRAQRFGPRTALASFLSRSLRLHGAVSPRRFRRTSVEDCGPTLAPIRMSPRLVRFFWATARRVTAAEFAVPATRAAEVLAQLDRLCATQPLALANPVGLRLTAGDAFSLSPCYGRETLWVDMFFYRTEPFVTSVRALFEEMGARPHWGKHQVVSPAYLRRQYPRWSGFQGTRARFDPDEVFANRFTDDLGLTGAAALGAAA